MLGIRLRVFWMLTSVLLLTFGLTPFASGAKSDGFIAAVGSEAAAFRVPGDMKLTRTLSLPAYGLTYERYQQYFGDQDAEVVGGQLTLYRDATNKIVSVTGRHYGRVVPRNTVRPAGTKAVQGIISQLKTDARPSAGLMIDPSDGAFYHRVVDSRPTSRWVWWVDAQTGSILRRFNDIAYNHGTGVKGDTKDMNGNDADPSDDITRFHSSSGHGQLFPHWDLISKDGRQVTYDCANNENIFSCPRNDVTDSDNHWTFVTSDRSSPGHPALVDAQYYANVADDYLQGRHGFNFLSCGHTAMESIAHAGVDRGVAFWSGNAVVYGDGETGETREFSGGLEIAAHEFTHGVTDCTSDLAIIFGPSASLNESFSDAMANSAEFFAGEPTSSNCVLASGQTQCADWWVGEDILIVADTVPGYRNMADPAEDGHADHFSEFDTSVSDEQVYINAGISNHAYFLLVNGGSNAGEARGHSHTGPVVTGIGVTDAERIWFLGFTGLPGASTTFCDARIATIAQAQTLFGSGSQQKASTRDAWEAVGVTASFCGS